MMVMLCARVATNSCYQTNNARFCLFCCMLVMKWAKVPVKREDENTCVSNYHLPVSIQHRLFNEKRKTIQLSDREVYMSSDRVLRPPWKWFVNSDDVTSWKPHHPSPKVFIVWSYFKDNPQMAYQVNGQNISMGSFAMCSTLAHNCLIHI